MMRRFLIPIIFLASILIAGSAGVVWRNDTTARTISFNDANNHQIVIGSYTAGGAWAPSGGAGSFTSLLLTGATSGTATITAPAVAGTPTLTLPITTGTFALTGATIASVTTQYFTATGAATYTPNAKMLYCIVEAIGGGGAGGSTADAVGGVAAAGGGASGALSKAAFTAAQIGASKALSVGLGGTPGAVGNNPGGAGADTTFGPAGSLLIAKGGGGAPGNPSNSAGNGGTPGAGSVGDQIDLGNAGGAGSLGGAVITLSPAAGQGAPGPYGGAPIGQNNNGVGSGTDGNAGTAPGAGGNGGTGYNSATGHIGGAGFKGRIAITEFNSG